MEVVALFALLPVLGAIAIVSWVLWQVFRGLRFILARVFRLIGKLLRRVGGFLKSEVVDVVHTAGAVITAGAIAPLALANLVIGRWSSARHYGRAVEDEATSVLLGIYRLGIRNPLRLVGLGGVLDGVERRVPDVVDRAPHSPRRRKREARAFPGYDVVGTLPEGGSGAMLFLARPRRETLERFREQGTALGQEVVIKSFALEEGSTLPQIVRESRALEAANRLGLVHEHHLADDRFYYVMPYVRGEELDAVTRRLHARSGPEGLGSSELALVLGYSRDLLQTLDRFHTGGLWHKDVKPANLIVSQNRAHLVDFGLVTPLASALTLTTHGTEYYRDPEMVRLAMQGVKVHEVDGVKFDLYSAGAVLFTMIEDSFPAHGSLSRITKRCPEALEWIVRRAMADIGTRYGAAWEMLDDLSVVLAASDPFSVRPADLPSFHRGAGDPVASRRPSPPAWEAEPVAFAATGAERASFAHEPSQPFQPHEGRRAHRRRVLAAAALFLLVVAATRGLTRAFHHEGSLGRGMYASTMAIPDRLYGPERDTYRAAQAIKEEFFRDPRGSLSAASELGLERVAAACEERVQDVEERCEDCMLQFAERWEEVLQPTLTRITGGVLAERDGKSRRRAVPANVLSGRVLVLEPLGSSVDPSTVRSLERTLAEHGLEVVGSDESREDADNELVAGARMAAGTGDPNDDAAALRLQRYLDRCDDLEAILWVAREGRTGEQVFRALVRREGVAEGTAAAFRN